MGRKGQASVEYIIILAVVIIIALVVVGVLGGFPQLTAGVSERESASYWISADIGVTRYLQNATGVFATFRNNKAFSVTLTNVILNLTSRNTTVLQAGSLTSGTETRGMVVSVAHMCAAQGDQFSIPMTIEYADSKGNYYNFTGAKQLVGTCTK